MATFFENLRAANKTILDKAMGMNALDRTIFLNNAKEKGKLQTKDDVNAILNNTFKTDKDGVNYSVGADGNTYAYYKMNDRIEGLILSLSTSKNRLSISYLMEMSP